MVAKKKARKKATRSASRSRAPVTARDWFRSQGFSDADLDDDRETFWNRVYAEQADELGVDRDEYKRAIKSVEEAKLGALVVIRGREFYKEADRAGMSVCWVGPYYDDDKRRWDDEARVAYTGIQLAKLFFKLR